MGAPLNTAARAGSQGRLPARLQAVCWIALVWVGCGAVVRAHADDRPFLRTTHAMASDDDDGWEVSSTLVANRQGQALSVQIEHDVSPTQRMEVEFGGSTRAAAPEPEQGLRLRSLWLSPETAGWGLATKVGVEPGRNRDEGAERWQALLVASVPWMQQRLWLHANVGQQWQRGQRDQSGSGNGSGVGHAPARTFIGSLAAHFVLTPAQWLYFETASAADGQDRWVHLGLRQWLKPRQWALDVGGGRLRAAEHGGDFVAINLSWMDLNF